jgi:hypothetical protein
VNEASSDNDRGGKQGEEEKDPPLCFSGLCALVHYGGISPDISKIKKSTVTGKSNGTRSF